MSYHIILYLLEKNKCIIFKFQIQSSENEKNTSQLQNYATKQIELYTEKLQRNYN